MKQTVYAYSYEMRRQRRRRVTFVITLIVSVVLFLSLFLNLILFPVRVNSDSMDSDIPRGASVFVTPMQRNPGRGDVVYLSRQDGQKINFFAHAANILVQFFTAQQYYPFGHSGNISAKPVLRRVLALPGDQVYMKDYILYVKPRNDSLFLTEFELVKKPYNVHIYSVPAEWDGMGSYGNMDTLTLGEDEYFVLADNRIEGTDSRVWGPVNGRRIRGRAVLEYFPFTKMRSF